MSTHPATIALPGDPDTDRLVSRSQRVSDLQAENQRLRTELVRTQSEKRIASLVLEDLRQQYDDLLAAFEAGAALDVFLAAFCSFDDGACDVPREPGSEFCRSHHPDLFGPDFFEVA